MSTESKRPRDRASWDERYAAGDIPWDNGIPDPNLATVLEAHRIGSGKVLEVGCGTGTNAIWLARQGFTVWGTDLSPRAIARAEAKAKEAGVDCKFTVGDFLVDEVAVGPFDLAYDRGVFHVFDEAEAQAGFAGRVAGLLASDGIWHSLLGSTDGPPRDHGPPRRSAAEITAAVEPHFEILELSSTRFDREEHADAWAWRLVARRR